MTTTPEAPPHQNSFFHDVPIKCPVCEHSFKKEVMRFGHGRLISIDIDAELKQTYKFSKKFGEIYPYIYNIFICPNCWFAALSEDFNRKDFYNYTGLRADEKFRRRQGRELSPQVDFDSYRTLENGLVGYFLAILCYAYCSFGSFAEAKKSIAAIRAAWCIGDIIAGTHDSELIPPYAALKQYFRYTAYLESSHHLKSLYKPAVSKDNFAVEIYGPDVNKDLGFNGFLYLNNYLSLEFLALEATAYAQYKRMEKSRNTLSKVFGFGKSSRQKPSVLMNKARDLYKEVKEKAEALAAENDFTLQKLQKEKIVLEQEPLPSKTASS